MKHVTMTGMTVTDAHSAKSGKPPLHQILVSFSAAYFVGGLLTDLAYWRAPDVVMWERFSVWLIAAGLFAAGLAVIAFVIDLAGGREMPRPVWPRAAGYAIAVLLSLVNVFVHSRDAYAAVVPTGLALSGFVVVVLLVTAWLGRAFTYQHRMGAGA